MGARRGDASEGRGRTYLGSGDLVVADREILVGTHLVSSLAH